MHCLVGENERASSTAKKLLHFKCNETNRMLINKSIKMNVLISMKLMMMIYIYFRSINMIHIMVI